MIFFQRFFRSKCCWALLIFAILVVAVFFKVIMLIAAEDGAENWSPYFIFTGSQECSLDRECSGKTGNSVRYWSFYDPDSFEDAFKMNRFYFPVEGTTAEGETLFIPIRAGDWQCVEFGNHFSDKTLVDPNRQDPRNGFVYTCWPSKPLPSLE